MILRDKDIHAFDNYKVLPFFNVNYVQYAVCTEYVRSPYTEHATSGLPNPNHLEGEVRFIQDQDQLIEIILLDSRVWR